MCCVVMAQAEVPTNRHAITTAITVPQPLALGYEITYPDLPELHFFCRRRLFLSATGWKN